MDEENSELMKQKMALECSVARLNQELQSKSKLLEVVEGNVMEVIPKLKEYKSLADGIKELEVRKKRLESQVGDLERYKEWQSNNAQCQTQSEVLDRRENESEVKGKRIVDDDVDSRDTIELQVVLEGKDVHMIFDGLKVDLSSRDEVSKVLRLSGDPALLVLEALEVICPPNVAKFNRSFDGNVGRGCLNILEQLFAIRANIESAREHALRLARKWKQVLCHKNLSEVLAFLYLLASFDIAHSFEIKGVKKLFRAVASLKKLPDLDQRLRLKDENPVFIKELIKKKQRVLAVDYASEFNLVHMFPPGELLKQHVLEVKKSAAKKPEDLEMISWEIFELEKVIKCIANHNLESEYPPDGLVERVAELEARRKNLFRKRAANEGIALPAKKLSRKASGSS